MTNRVKRLACIILAICIIGGAILMIVLKNLKKDNAEKLKVYGLTCEYNCDPEVVDEEFPLLAWKLSSEERGVVQTKYRIVASTSLDKLKNNIFDAWDSGEIENDKTTQIKYMGKKEAGQDYYWRVQVWDNKGNNAMSEPAKFGIGPLEEEDWSGAVWITNAAPESTGEKNVNYTVECDFQLVQSSAGIIFGALTHSDFYMWQFNEADGASSQKVMLRPHVWKNGSPSCLANVDISEHVSWDDRHKPHHMRIEVGNGSITTFIDGKQVDKRSSLLTGGPGLVGVRASKGNDGKEEIAYYDNFKVTVDGEVVLEEDFSNKDECIFDDAYIESGRLLSKQSIRDFVWQKSDRKLPYLRKDFSTQNKKIERAKIYSSALGVYEMYINGQRVGKDYLAPGWTDYDKRVAYQGYNVTDLIEQGKANVFGVRLAPGWYSGKLGIAQGEGHYGKDVAFISKLQIDYSDGTSQIIVTDESWKFTEDTPLITSDIIDGEYYDARNQIGSSVTSWATTEVSCDDWFNVYIKDTKRNLIANVDPPIQVTDEIKAKEIWRLNNGNFVVDFGQNFAGVVKITVKGNPGDVVTIKHGEVLNQDGKTVHTANLRAAKATDTYIIGSNEPETYMPSFTFHGFRFIEVSGLESLDIDDVVGMAIGSNLVRTNTFECSNEMVNQLYSNIVWGQKGNYLSIPTDCPQRDERRGWTGDAQVFVRTGCYNMDSVSFYRKFMTDVRDAQRRDGAYPSVAPSKGFEAYGAHAWGDAGVICVWTIYKQYGDIRIVEENFEAMEKFIQYYVRNSRNLTFNDTTYGDWLSVHEETDKGLIATAFFAYSTKLLAEMADDMAKTTGEKAYQESAAYHSELFEDIKAAYIEKYVKPSGICGNDTQCSYVLSLAFDLLPEELKPKAAERLAQNIMIKRGGHLTTGFVSVGRLCPVLTEYGYNDIAFKLLTNKTYPSWGYSIERGATTIWERWNSCLDDGTIDERLAHMNSLNHYSLGAIGEWMFTDMLGIDWDSETPGFKKFVLKPNPVNDKNIDMTYAKGTYESIHGTIKSEWAYEEDGTLVYKATVPANTKATLYLPVKEGAEVVESGKKVSSQDGIKIISEKDGMAVYELESGKYEFRVK